MKQNEELIEIKSCPVCSSSAITAYIDTKDFFFTQVSFSLTKCNDCDFVFTNPIPSNLNRYYDTPDYLSHNTNSNSLISNLYSAIRNINIKRKYKLVIKYCPSGTILDIGCGTGELLNYFSKKNWSVTGVEPNASVREFAINSNNINVLDERSLDELEPNSFDVITMWHVLEHVPNLNSRLEQLNNLLKYNGTIIIALPNLDSPDSKKYKQYWSALDVPRHLYHFTQKTFVSLISKHNLKLIHSEPMRFDSYYVSLLSEKYLKNPFYLPAALYNGFISNLKAKESNNYSSMIFVVKKQ